MAITATIGTPEGSSTPSVQVSIPADDAVAVLEGLAKAASLVPLPQLQELYSIISKLVPKP